MTILIALILGLLLVPLIRGAYSELAAVSIRGIPLIPLGVILQLLPARLTLPVAARNVELVLVLSWLAGAGILLVVCWRNRWLAGFRLCALGLLANSLVIALNRGMPVSEQALDALNVDAASAGILEHNFYHVAREGTRLLFLGDVLPLAGPRVLESVLSLGDMLLLLGIVVVVLECSLPRGQGSLPS